jgi:Outer membrane protein beta-barrel domain
VADSCRFCHPRRIDVRGGGSALQTDTEETTVIMNANASRLSSALVSTAAALLMTVGASAQAQELQPARKPLGVYVGGTAGIGVNNWHCDENCDRAVFSGKVFAAKRLTPGLAAEVNYFIFGERTRTNEYAVAQTQGYNFERRKSNALALGINWEVDLIHDVTNQIRVGFARVKQEDERNLLNGATTTVKSDFTAPYLGAGLAFRLTNEIKLLSNADVIFKGRRSEYLLSIGAMAEF